jgi:5-methyltetrahydrofolate--homocysteine methyltransferase
MSKELTEAVTELREQEALQITDRLLASGTDPLQIVESCRKAMDEIGRRFSAGQAFIPELIMAGEIMQAISAKVKPHLAATGEGKKLGSVVLCTVKGDIHDIGKDIVRTMLDIAGFNVVDLGVDVSYEAVVAKVREVEPQVVGLSGLLTAAFDSMKGTVEALNDAGLHAGRHVMIGGAPVNEDVRAYAGADGWAKDAVGAVELAKTWVGGA